MRKKVIVNDRMQRGYVYWRTEPAGRNFAPGFTPDLTPKEMLRLGVFGGKYMTDCREEFPRSWFARRQAVRRAARRAPELFRRERVAVARRVAPQRLDPHAGSARVVSVVLPLLHGPAEPPTTPGRFDAGVRSPDTWRRFGSTANRAISNAGGGSGRPSFTGRTTAERSRKGVTCVCS